MPFKYLGSFVADSKKFEDFLTRKAQAWKACNKLYIIWQSTMLFHKYRPSLLNAKPDLQATAIERKIK